MKRRALVRLAGAFAALVSGLAPRRARALGFGFNAPAGIDDPALAAAIADLATRMLPVYEEPDPERYLATLSVLQLAAGDDRAAHDTRESLRERQRNARPGRPLGRGVVLDLYAEARAAVGHDAPDFATAYRHAFEATAPRLGGRELRALAAWLGRPQPELRERLAAQLERLAGRGTIEQDAAIELVRAYVDLQAYRASSPWLGALLAAEERRRYVTQDDVVIRTSSGARIHAVVVRRVDAAPMPTLLEFAIDASPDHARVAAAHDYVGVVAYPRGKREPAGGPVLPFRHDADDARAVIDWIAGQKWSDGRVAMYGDGYGGFAAWSVAVDAPKALKAIATGSPMAPGIDFPMRGRIFRTCAYRWAERHTGAEPAPPAAAGDDARWRGLEEAWYRSGQRYRALETLPGAPARAVRDLVREWLSHPSFDRYWQRLVPFGREFAQLELPVLTTTGCFARGEEGALYYHEEHLRHARRANHTLVVGPYDDDGAVPALPGERIEPGVAIDLGELRMRWFDHVLLRAPRPPELAARLNVAPLGGGWLHAPDWAALAPTPLRLHLAPGSGHGPARLVAEPPAADAHVELTVDLRDRSDAGRVPPAGLFVPGALAPPGALVFAGEPFARPLSLAGRIEGEFDVLPNAQDVDLSLALYRQRADGACVALGLPWEFRASYLQDRVRRRLLQAGVRQRLPFASERVFACRFEPGSRLVVVLAVVKRPEVELNLGTGQDVSEESVADVPAPLRLRWYATSHLRLPTRPG